MKKISFILALLMILGTMFAFSSCVGDKASKDNKIDPADAVLGDMVKAIEAKVPYSEKVSEILYMENDPDEMVKWTYGVVDLNANELLCDYVITMPADYSHTLAILKFEDGMTDEDFEEVKAAITTEYIRSRSSALQMYMPDEYANMEWALANPDKVWHRYGDNMLVLAITVDEEPKDVWTAIDNYLAGK
ncbi:MAG: hypothetical protein E7647_08460 [Ruminococcaceae bacterium]|nr:hypothetical protein [Oscillospiraceae bacterium]